MSANASARALVLYKPPPDTILSKLARIPPAVIVTAAGLASYGGLHAVLPFVAPLASPGVQIADTPKPAFTLPRDPAPILPAEMIPPAPRIEAPAEKPIVAKKSTVTAPPRAAAPLPAYAPAPAIMVKLPKPVIVEEPAARTATPPPVHIESAAPPAVRRRPAPIAVTPPRRPVMVEPEFKPVARTMKNIGQGLARNFAPIQRSFAPMMRATFPMRTFGGLFGQRMGGGFGRGFGGFRFLRR